MGRTTLVAAVLLLLGWLSANRAAERPSPQPPPVVTPQAAEFFEKTIRPLLSEGCFRCHGPEKQKGDLRLDSRAALLEGGESGPAIVPGNPDRSLLIQAVRHAGTVQMPPKKKLPPRAIAALTAWVKMGAPWPNDRVVAANPQNKANARTGHWAFQPVRRPAVPVVKDAGWVRSPIDAFVRARLEANHMRPSRPADRRTLLRRASFDLVGLPPTAAEVAAFEADRSPDAFARVVDRLLASPRYGERWARHWLDVARYADTKGYVFTEERRFPYAYTFRDYVIRAFNEDLPYDQFVVQQLAADRLPRGDDRGALAAMGFLTVGRRFLNNPHDIIDDRIDVVCRGFLGLTVSCARCHDHKFDPIPMRDYYSLYGVFASSVEPRELPLLGSPEKTPAYLAFEKELRAREQKLNEYLQNTHEELTAKLRALVVDYLLAVRDRERPANEPALSQAADLKRAVLRRWQMFLNQTRRQHHPIFAPWHAFAALPAKDFAARAPALAAQFAANADRQKPINPHIARAFAGQPPASLRQVAEKYGEVFAAVDRLWERTLTLASLDKGKPLPKSLKDPHQEALRQVLYAPEGPVHVPITNLRRFVDQGVRLKLAELRGQVEKWKLTSPAAPPRAMVLEDLPNPVTPRVLLRGNPNNAGPAVPRQFLGVLAGDRRQPFRQGSGRLELARAIADRNNPLTARVLVNRLWLHHFGAGLVRTPSDFGLRSDLPTHPELLDYLARRFMDERWSVKKMHRLIMLSSVYQQDSEGDPRYHTRDPDNRLLWKMNRRRLDFEAMRDSLLAVSGKLDGAMNGRPVDLTRAPFTGRRSVYGFIDRQNLPGLFRSFDFASPDASSPQRFTTTVPQQALFLLNSPFVVEQARRLVNRPGFTALPESDRRIQDLYRRVYARPAEEDEVKLGLRFLEAAQKMQGPQPLGGAPAAGSLTPWEKYAQVLLLANEFVFVD
jgi:hypothetical protein